MTITTQRPRTGEFLLSESNGQRSRETITLAATTEALEAGQILSKDSNGNYVTFEAPAEGEAVEVALLWAYCPASTDPQDAAGIVRDAEIIGDLLIDLDVDSRAALAAQGLVIR